MEDKESGQKYFCYMTVNSLPSMIVQIVLTVLSLLLVGDAFRKYYRMRGSHNRHVVLVYWLLIAWWISYIIANIFGVTIFSISDENNPQTSKISKLSKFYVIIDWLSAFLIQWILLYLPYQWSKQISEIFDTSRTVRGSQVEFVNTNYKGYETKIYRTLKHYMRIRMLYLIILGVFIGIESIQEMIFQIMVIFLLVDCLFITTSLLLGMKSLKQTQQLKQQLDEEQTKRTINQYIVVIIANTIRFAFDAYYFYLALEGHYFQDSCPRGDINFTVEIGIMIISCILTFYLPVFIILRIYSLQEKPELMCQSLIISSQNHQDPKIRMQN